MVRHMVRAFLAIAVIAGLCVTVGVTSYLGGYIGRSGETRLTDAQLIELFHDLKADCLDGSGEHAKLACQRGISVVQEIEARGLVK